MSTGTHVRQRVDRSATRRDPRASTSQTAAFQQQTRTIPIVFVMVSDPIGSGFVESLPRPGGNITGFMLKEGEWRANGWSCSRRSRPVSGGQH